MATPSLTPAMSWGVMLVVPPTLPQHEAVPPVWSAQVKSRPDATSTASEMPPTGRGSIRVASVPLPNCRDSLSPQQCTRPSVPAVHVCMAPALTATALGTGAASGKMVRAVETMRVRPQHMTCPPVIIAQACSSPAVM